MPRTWTFFLLIVLGLSTSGIAQTAPVYPRVVGYIGVLHPLVSFSRSGKTANFGSTYTVGMPTGVNIWKTARLGYSLEVVPFVRAANGTSKVNNVLVHPGILFGLGRGFTLASRFAFETSGRYGFTPVVNKTFNGGKGIHYFLAIPLPARLGNDQDPSLGVGFQFGIAF